MISSIKSFLFELLHPQSIEDCRRSIKHLCFTIPFCECVAMLLHPYFLMPPALYPYLFIDWAVSYLNCLVFAVTFFTWPVFAYRAGKLKYRVAGGLFGFFLLTSFLFFDASTMLKWAVGIFANPVNAVMYYILLFTGMVVPNPPYLHDFIVTFGRGISIFYALVSLLAFTTGYFKTPGKDNSCDLK